jgi:Phosphotransferase enzyme family
MEIILDTDNVFKYLADLNYCQIADRENIEVTLIPAKNFNLLLTFNDGKTLLVKQENRDYCGQTKGEFWAVWQMQELMATFPDFGDRIRHFLPELIYFDPVNSILIVNYLTDYSDLYRYYINENQFPIKIAIAIGKLLASIHSQTFDREQYKEFLTLSAPNRSLDLEPSYVDDLIHRLAQITPDIFAMMPIECHQFFKLYQRFPSLTRSITELRQSIEPSCLIHNDLKLNNLLLDLQWQQPGSQLIKLIDWERAAWGDPAFDLGCLLGSYLEIWLDGMAISNTLSINESLQLATTPLELLQPSLGALVEAYLDSFPEIIAARIDYLDRAIQFTGLALIQRIEINIDETRTFGNRGIMMLQIAKQLLCEPQASINILFGTNFNRSKYDIVLQSTSRNSR